MAAGELAQTSLAARYWADSYRLYRDWLKAFPVGSYEGGLWTAAEPVFQVEVAVALGELARAREHASSARERLLRMKPGDDPGRQQSQAFFLRRLHFAMGRAELEAKDFIAAEQQFRLLVEPRRVLWARPTWHSGAAPPRRLGTGTGAQRSH